MQYYIYILFSQKANKYYIGYSPDPFKRLEEHDSYTNKRKFTAKYQPWILKASFMVSDSLSDVRKVELFIKKQKSRKFLEMIIDRSNNKEFIHEIIKKSLAYSGPDASGLIRRS